MKPEEIFDHRKNKFLKIGRGGGFIKPSSEGETGLTYKEPIFLKLRRIFTQNKYISIAASLSYYCHNYSNALLNIVVK